MKTNRNLRSATVLMALFTLGGCANVDAPYSSEGTQYPPATSSSGYYPEYGVVQSIDRVMVDNRPGVGAGTIAGAVIGGVVGNQVGSGSGNTAATVLGAAGGAYVGHELEKRNQQGREAFRITVRLQNGTHQTVTQTSNADLRVGDRVLIDNGIVRRY